MNASTSRQLEGRPIDCVLQPACLLSLIITFGVGSQIGAELLASLQYRYVPERLMLLANDVAIESDEC